MRLLGRRLLPACVAAVLCVPALVTGQEDPVPGDPPDSVSLRLGPLALAPTLTVNNVGWDSNVFHQAASNPPDDFTAMARPSVEAWLRVGPARIQGRSAVGFSYFRDYSSERSTGFDHEGRVTVPLGRFTPYVSTRWINERERFGLEIDTRTRRHHLVQNAGTDVRLGPRTQIGVSARRSHVEFATSAAAGDPVFAGLFDHTSAGFGVSVRRDLTPLTSIAVALDRGEDRFQLAPERDSQSHGAYAGVEFKPFALISGHAHVGWRRVSLVNPDSPPVKAFTASVNLAYTLLEATRFSLEVQRDVAYSAIRGEHAFLFSGFTSSVTHRLGDRWDVGGRTGRHWLSYGLFDIPGLRPGEDGGRVDSARELVTEYVGELGYRIAPPMRVSFQLGRQNRSSSVGTAREWGRTRATMSINYRF